jgi:hypothetical protein
MNKTLKKILLSSAICVACGAASAQVPSVIAPGFVVDAFESIGVVPDSEGGNTSGAVARKVYTVPAGRAFRLTDLSVDPRNASTAINPCFFELWRGNDTQPLTLAWSRVRVFGTATYDRSWVTGPQFNAGEALWVIGRFDPFNANLRMCTRFDQNSEAQLRYALRGYLVRGGQ